MMNIGELIISFVIPSEAKLSNNMPESFPEQIRGQPKEGKKDVLFCIDVHVDSHHHMDDVLNAYPGYVQYDPEKHDISGIKVLRENIISAPNIPTDHAYRIVKEV